LIKIRNARRHPWGEKTLLTHELKDEGRILKIKYFRELGGGKMMGRGKKMKV